MPNSKFPKNPTVTTRPDWAIALEIEVDGDHVKFTRGLRQNIKNPADFKKLIGDIQSNTWTPKDRSSFNTLLDDSIAVGDRSYVILSLADPLSYFDVTTPAELENAPKHLKHFGNLTPHLGASGNSRVISFIFDAQSAIADEGQNRIGLQSFKIYVGPAPANPSGPAASQAAKPIDPDVRWPGGTDP